MDMRFSERLRVSGLAVAPLVIDVPPVVRLRVLDVACDCGVRPGMIRMLLEGEFRVELRRSSSTADLWAECRDLIQGCGWPGVYDTAEAVHDLIAREDWDCAGEFELELNRLFRDKAISFRMAHGRIALSANVAAVFTGGSAVASIATDVAVLPTRIQHAPSTGHLLPFDPVSVGSVEAIKVPLWLALCGRFLSFVVSLSERPGTAVLWRGCKFAMQSILALWQSS